MPFAKKAVLALALVAMLQANPSNAQTCNSIWEQCGGASFTGSTCCDNGEETCIYYTDEASYCNPQPRRVCSIAYGQCGGTGYTGPTCCEAGYECTAASEWWSACTPLPPDGSCSAEWGQCGGSEWTGATCCLPGSQCVYQSESYSQCLATDPAATSCGSIGEQCGGSSWAGATCCGDPGTTCVQDDIEYSECRSLPTPAPEPEDPTDPTDPNDPGMDGDPHVKSWTGEWFDFMGECDLKLVHVESFDGKQDLAIHARTTVRYSYSFIETLAVRIGNDTLEVSSWGEHALNGVENAMVANTPAQNGLRKQVAVPDIGGYPIIFSQVDKKKTIVDISLGEGQRISIKTMKDLVGIAIHNANERQFGNTVGLLGNFHGQLLARDAATDLHDNADALGQEWQVRDNEPMLFRTARAPQYPARCNLPVNPDEREARRLGEGIQEEAAKLACSHLKGSAFDACVYDVTATNDLDMAQSGAF